ncbi:MAG: TonB-dependent receptor, partial [Bacteroidota bacterium]
FQFKPDKIATLPGWGEPDVLRLLQFLPGVGSLDESASRLYVRGGTPDQNLIQLDGIPIYHTGHFFGLYDAFNPFIVSEVDVWRGNFGAEFGGRNSSVIDIDSKSELNTKTQGGVGLNLLSLQGYLLFPMKKNKSSLLVAGRRSYTDLIQSTTYQNLFNQLFQNGKVVLERQQLEDNQYFSWNPDFNYGDFNLKFAWHGKRQRESAFSLYFGEDHLDYRFAYDDSSYFASTNDVIAARNMGISWQHRAQWSPVFQVKYKVALSAYANDYAFLWNDNDRSQPFTYRFDRNNSLTEFAMQFHHDWQVSEQHRMSFGYQFSGQEARLIYSDTTPATGLANLIANDTTRSGLHTFYGEFRYQVSPRFEFMLGIRENHFIDRTSCRFY